MRPRARKQRNKTVCNVSELQEISYGHLEKLLPLAIADSSGVNVNESERERSGIIRGQFYGVWRGGAIFRGALMLVGLSTVHPFFRVASYSGVYNEGYLLYQGLCQC